MADSIEKYIQAARKKGWPDAKIKSALINSGWQQNDIDPFFDDDLLPPPPPPPSSSNITKTHSASMWDAFMHILMFISLYASTIAILWILHSLIDDWFPKYSYYNYSSYQNEILRMPLAILIVAFPFFAFLFYKTTRASLKNPDLKQLPTRKGLIYLTLVITFITMLISMIVLVFSFLSGDITTRFILKFLVTAGVAGLIFAYYLAEVKS